MKNQFNQAEMCLLVEFEINSEERNCIPIQGEIGDLLTEIEICKQLSAEEKDRMRNLTHNELVKLLQIEPEVFDLSPDKLDQITHLIFKYFGLSNEAAKVYEYLPEGVGIFWFIDSSEYGLNDFHISDSQCFKWLYEDVFE